ncbi:hypothetical protein [uncultured Fusobacterium sp.]|uniref:hypothetical protein n=1 Tax=uncultured Fusobacterium sp. TaxID=159267 RepID=UPI000BBB21D2|nr:hypothetical protein [uncultured Fusobacterium sp.]BBA52041.1 hypothetical protein FV113G1_23910 [Fusobacterium varium]
MKKLQLTLLIIFTFVIFTTEHIKAAGNLAEKYINEFKGKDVMMHFIMHSKIEEKNIKSDITVATLGEKSVTKMEYEGKVVRFLVEGKKSYMISDKDKMAMNLSMLGINSSIFKQPEYIGIEITDSGTDIIMGEKLPYEEMSVKNGEKIRYYFKGNELAYITGKGVGSDFIMEILECTTKVPVSIFEIPKEYRVINGLKDMGL